MSKHPLSSSLRAFSSHAEVCCVGAQRCIHGVAELAAGELDRLHALEAKLEEVAGLPGKWDMADVLTVAERHVIANSGVVKVAVDLLASDLRSALVSTGPSLRERVQAALADIRTHSAADYNNERIYAYDIASDLVQAALEEER